MCQVAGIAQPAQDTISDNETQEHNFYQLTLNFKKYIITVPQQQIQWLLFLLPDKTLAKWKSKYPPLYLFLKSKSFKNFNI